MSAHRHLLSNLHATGTCDDCDQERDQREQEHDDAQQEQQPHDGRSE